MTIFKNAFALLQKIGKCMMLPVSVLPVAGILLGVGSANFSWLPQSVSQVMAASGNAIFASLPLIFAIGIAIGLTDNDGVAALAGTVGFVVFLAAMGVCAKLRGIETKDIMGLPSIETGVFGGLVVGFIAAWAFKRFYRLQLPSYLGFFAGKRSVPIITAFAVIAVGGLLSFVWPPIGGAIDRFSHWAVHERPVMAFTIYGIVERALIPFGLHHVWNVPFFFQAGSYTDPATGAVVHGEIARFIAGDPTAGNMTGGYLFKMWGLPAAAIAMWRAARKDQRLKIGSIMISAALTAFLTGITEPIEFSFLFVAPVLYAVHALLAGAAYFVCVVLDIPARIHVFARADRLCRVVPEVLQSGVAACARTCVGGRILRHLHICDPPFQPDDAGPGSRGGADSCSAQCVRRPVRTPTGACLRRPEKHCQPGCVYHATAGGTGGRHPGQQRKA
jgi:PTS system glucose-specific IIC component